MANDTYTRIASLKISVAGRPIEMEVEVPDGPARPRQLLPLLQSLADEVVDIAYAQAAQAGRCIACKAGCGACFRHLVPISQAEAYRLAELVAKLPEPRRGEIRRRFQAAEERLRAAGLLERLAQLPDDAAASIWSDYFRLGVACPFLENESCSIHSERPLVCQEYLVVSPAENCRPTATGKMELVLLPVSIAYALREVERGAVDDSLPCVPLSLALHWVAEHPEPTPRDTGTALLRDVLQFIIDQQTNESPPANKGSLPDGRQREN